MSNARESLEAQLRGEDYFIPSTPCPSGHFLRYAREKPRCVECSRAISKTYHKLNPEMNKARMQKFIRLNPNYTKERYANRAVA